MRIETGNGLARVRKVLGEIRDFGLTVVPRNASTDEAILLTGFDATVAGGLIYGIPRFAHGTLGAVLTEGNPVFWNFMGESLIGIMGIATAYAGGVGAFLLRERLLDPEHKAFENNG